MVIPGEYYNSTVGKYAESMLRAEKISQMSYPNQDRDAVKYLLFPRMGHDKIFLLCLG